MIKLFLLALLLGVCIPSPALLIEAPEASEIVAGSSQSAEEWQTYINTVVGLSIEAPPTWSQQKLADQAEGAIYGISFTETGRPLSSSLWGR